MKIPALLALTALSLAGCGDERAVPNATFAKSSEPAAAKAGSCGVLPEGITLQLPYTLASDYYMVNVTKVIRHRVVLQFTEGTLAEVEESIKKSMLAAGFSFHDVRPGKGGGTHSRYKKKGYGMAHILLDPNAASGDHLVKGTITFDLPPPQFNPPSVPKKQTPANTTPPPAK